MTSIPQSYGVPIASMPQSSADGMTSIPQSSVYSTENVPMSHRGVDSEHLWPSAPDRLDETFDFDFLMQDDGDRLPYLYATPVDEPRSILRPCFFSGVQ